MKKSSLVVIIASLILIVILAWVFIINNTKTGVLEGNKQSLQQNSTGVWQSQVSEEGSVNVEVTPIILAPGSEARFNISFNTHSIELNFDLLKAAQLTDDQGNSLKPTSWTGGMGGHHLSGELDFPALAPEAKQVKLTLPGISGVDREFEWKI